MVPLLPSDKVMILGGYQRNSTTAKRKVNIFDPKTKSYDTSLPSMNYDRMNAGCAIFQSAYHENRTVVLIVGGWKAATAEVYDFTKLNSSWTESKIFHLLIIFLIKQATGFFQMGKTPKYFFSETDFL